MICNYSGSKFNGPRFKNDEHSRDEDKATVCEPDNLSN